MYVENMRFTQYFAQSYQHESLHKRCIVKTTDILHIFFQVLLTNKTKPSIRSAFLLYTFSVCRLLLFKL